MGTSQPSVEELLARRTKSLVGKTVQGVLTVLDKKPIAFIKWNDKRDDNIFVKLDNVDVPLDLASPLLSSALSQDWARESPGIPNIRSHGRLKSSGGSRNPSRDSAHM